VLIGDVPGLDGAQRRPPPGDPESRLDAEFRVEGEVLREVGEAAADGHRPVGGPQPAREQAQQGGLAGPVGADEARAAPADGEREPVEDLGAVRPPEGQGGAAEGRGGGGGWVHVVLAVTSV
jgi:hypothetical protein